MTFPFPQVVAEFTPVLSYRTQIFDETDQSSSYTFSSVDLGPPSPNRYIVVGASIGSPNTINAMTIGGVSATSIAIANNSVNSQYGRMYIANVPTGSTGNIVVGVSGATFRCQIGVWALYGINSATPTDTATTTSNGGSLAVDVSAKGLVVAYFGASNPSNSTTWVGLNRDFDTSDGGPTYGSGASSSNMAAETNRTITATKATGANISAMAASWR